jgi:hypothetical protein
MSRRSATPLLDCHDLEALGLTDRHGCQAGRDLPKASSNIKPTDVAAVGTSGSDLSRRPIP